MKSLALLSTIVLSVMFAPGVTSGALSSWYTDVPDKDAYHDGIYYMTQAGFVTGYEDSTFLPKNPVSRVEALKMILSAAEVELVSPEYPTPFTDIDSAQWYQDYLDTSVSLEIISGYPDGTFKPLETVNRAEALKMLVLASNKKSELPGIESDEWYTAYMAYATEHALLVPDSSGDYIPGATLTRGELADLIKYLQSLKP